MKVCIAVDIEGITGLASLNESRDIDHEWYTILAGQMHDEAVAAAEGAVAGGADVVVVVDAHGGNECRNIRPLTGFPKETKLMRGLIMDGKSCHGLDETYDALILIGHHDLASNDGSPASHTLNRRDISWIKMNGEKIGEVGISGMEAAVQGVPLVMVSGDEACCSRAKTYNPNIVTVATKKGIGYGIISETPENSCNRIREAAEKAVRETAQIGLFPTPEYFSTEVRWNDHHLAKRAALYPGAEQIDPNTVIFESDDIFDVSKFYFFTI